jgi:NFU1 iron-sulfur cluster scaffold homolog, mitochondrial
MEESMIKIWAEPQADPSQCKFNVEHSLVSFGAHIFEKKEDAKDSHLAEVLFDIEGVEKLIIASDHLLIALDAEHDWRTVGKEVGKRIRTAISSGNELVAKARLEKSPEETILVESVQKVLKEQINPSVAEHGGAIELLDVKKNDIFIKMSGGCQGCGMAAETLKRGVEESLRKAIPDLGQVYDTTDHSAGSNPFYAPK